MCAATSHLNLTCPPDWTGRKNWALCSRLNGSFSAGLNLAQALDFVELFASCPGFFLCVAQPLGCIFISLTGSMAGLEGFILDDEMTNSMKTKTLKIIVAKKLTVVRYHASWKIFPPIFDNASEHYQSP